MTILPALAISFDFIMRAALASAIIIIAVLCLIFLFSGNHGKMTLAQLINPEDGKTAEINSWEISIGRARTCDVWLDSDKIARFHAVIVRRGKGWLIFDVERKLGVKVNGNPIKKKAYIFDGDLITIGDCVLAFRSPLFRRKVKAAKENAPKPSGISQSQSKVAAAQKAGSKSIAVLVRMDDSSLIPLFKDRYVLGRGSGCDIVLPSLNMAKEHAVLQKSASSWTVSALKSRTGVLVNDKQTEGVKLLHDGDMLHIGGILFKYVADYSYGAE